MNNYMSIDTVKIIESLNKLRKKDEVIEVRAFVENGKKLSGYFDNVHDLAKNVSDIRGNASVYVTLNPVNAALKARSYNRLSQAKQTTSDHDIVERTYLFIDVDPVRPSGISSSDEEHEGAIKTAKAIRKFLLDHGWPKPVLADSGNGAHLLYAINLPNDTDSTELVKNVLTALDFKFSRKSQQVDCTTFNASRLIKLYGTKSSKGDHTPERPHRISRIIHCPDELEIVSKNLLQALACLMPNIQDVPKKVLKERGLVAFNVEQWLKDHGLAVSRTARWQNKATKYILKSCPWDENHTDASSYVIQFDSGAVVAGCHHQSCQGNDWRRLRELFEPEANLMDNAIDNNEKENAALKMIKLVQNGTFFLNEVEEPYAKIEVNGHEEVFKIGSQRFKGLLRLLYFRECGKPAGTESLIQAVSTLEAMALYSKQVHYISRRIGRLDTDIYYDLGDSEWRAVKISPSCCQIISRAPISFVRTKTVAPQVVPHFRDPADLMKLLSRHFRFQSKRYLILFAVYLVSCFIPDIPHPLLLLAGEKGAAKSTSLRMSRAIVDPSRIDLLSMPNSKDDLVITLNNHYMPCFDNLDSLSAEKSDVLCMSSTGGSISKRTLFTNDDETILNLKRCVALNGTSVVVTRPDLLDRTIIIDLKRIPKNERKDEASVWKAFNLDMPEMFGACLQAVSKAMVILPTVVLSESSRMADFAKWGYAIAEALGIGGNKFLKAYDDNRDRANEEVISTNPVAVALLSFMEGRSHWKGDWTQLLALLNRSALKKGISTYNKLWPAGAQALSRRMNDIKSNLEEAGIHFVTRQNAKKEKILTLQNTNHESQPIEENDQISCR